MAGSPQPGAPFTATEQQLLAAVPAALRHGVELLHWWQRKDVLQDYEVRYEETFVFNRPEDRSDAFFDTAPLSSGPQRVNGNVQTMFYDEPKSPAARQSRQGAAEWVNQQVREFVLHYFMRISDFRQPQRVPEHHAPAPPGLGLLSQCVQGPERGGFGFSQLFARRPGEEPERFPAAQQERIVDLRRVGGEFEWIVLRNPIYNFKFELKPFGEHGPQLALPLSEFNYLVLSRDFVIDQARPEPGILGRYGLGYAFVDRPEPSALGYGPGELEPAFELLVWDVHDSGKVTVRATFVAKEPTAVLKLSVDPFAWGFQLADVMFGSPEVKRTLAPIRRLYNRLPWSRLRFDPVFPALDMLNLLTFNQASERLCISSTQLKKEFLFLHFLQHYQTILGSLQTWRQVPDWLDQASLPAFVVTGRSS